MEARQVVMNTEDWPARPYIFALQGAFTALLVYLLIDGISRTTEGFFIRVALASAILTFSLCFGIITKRDKLLECGLYALLMALVIGGIFYSRLFVEWQEPFGFVASGIAVFVLSPFFQSWLYRKPFDYQALHHHAWTNTLTGGLSFLFVGLSFLLAYLLAALFSLIEIDLIKDLLREDLFSWILYGTAFGASVGVLREYDSIIGSTQSVVQSIFSLLVSPLALGFAVFLLLLPFTGLGPLWNSTQHTSATLFTCAAFALLVVNAILRDSIDAQSKSRTGLTAARVLALTITPLVLVSAIALALRVEQYGWTPDRMWGAVICAVLLLYGIAYLIAAMCKQFPDHARSVNRSLAVVVCVLAFLLATPLFDFGMISTQSQLARLANNEVSEDKLDLTAMAFDFGPSGREALVVLKEDSSEKLGRRIDKVLASRSRRIAARESKITMTVDELRQKLVVDPASQPVTDELLHRLIAVDNCVNEGYCYVFFSDSAKEALVLDRLCYDTLCSPNLNRYQLLANGKWLKQYSGELISSYKARTESKEHLERLDMAATEGKVEIRPVQRRQLFIDGVPLEQTIE